MSKRILLAIALSIAYSNPVMAQTAAHVVPGYESISGCPGSVSACWNPAVTAAALAGTQTNLTISSATAPTVPTGASLLVFQAQGTNNAGGSCLRYRDDGTNPTSTTGIQVPNLATVTYRVVGTPIKFIQDSGATCTVTIAYYK